MANWLTEIRGPVPRGWSIFLGFLPVVGILLIWILLTAGEEPTISPVLLPGPGETFSADMIERLFVNAKLFDNILVSLRRVALGYLVAAVIVIPLGVMMGAFGSVRATFLPATAASGYIPIVTLVPITMALFKTGELQKVVFLSLAFGIYLLPLVLRAVQNVPDTYLRTGYTLGAGRTQTVFRVLVPIALPEIWHAMRLAFGIGWTYLVLAEMVDLSGGGLGAMVLVSQRRSELRAHMYLVVIVITLIAWASDLGWSNLGKLLFPYRRSRS